MAKLPHPDWTRRVAAVFAAVGALSFAAALAADPTASDPPHPGYTDGVAAMKAKDLAGAQRGFEACLAALPTQTDCRWELGWVHWSRSDWAQVVAAWEQVEQQEPTRAGLSRYLPQARDNLQLDAVLARGRAAAPKTVSTAVPAGTRIRIRAVGDLMIGTDFPEGALQVDDAKANFAGVADWLQDADLTFGNLEGPLCDTGATDKCKPDATPGSCYAFRSPGRYAPLYKAAGFDLLSTANNHAGDFGEQCRAETERLLDAQGIGHSGRPGDFASVEVKGVKVGMIGFHTSQATHDVNDHERAAALVRAMAADHDIVIVSFHGGAEGAKALHVPAGPETFYNENRGDLRQFTRTVIEAGADLVLGHGPHVLRAIELRDGRLVAYSLGNFSTYGRFNLSGNLGVGAVLEVDLAPDGRFLAGRILPTRQINDGVPVKDLVEEGGKGTAIDLVRTLSAEDFPTTGVTVAQDGRLAAPATPTR